MNPLAAKQRILIDLIGIRFLFGRRIVRGFTRKGEVARPLRAILNVG